MKRGDILFLDTNILLTSTDSSRLQHKLCRELFQKALSGGLHLAISNQIVREYLVVATRPVSVNGLGLSTKDSLHNIRQFMNHCMIIEETEVSLNLLIEYVGKFSISGKHIHDINLIAIMAAYNIKTLITMNPSDFKLFPELTVLGPDSLMLQAGRQQVGCSPMLPKE